jgi:hypothetical protein
MAEPKTLTKEQIEERLNCALDYRGYKLNRIQMILSSDRYDRRELDDLLDELNYWNGSISAYRDMLDPSPRRDLMVLDWKRTKE